MNRSHIHSVSLFRKSQAVNSGNGLETWGHLLLRVSAGLMIFYIHGLHKLQGWIAHVQYGTRWNLADEVAGMHFPLPVASAVVATMVQFICSAFVVVGLFTRINAALLAAALSGAILQNVLSGRDPQLAVLYTLIVVTLILMGGGKYSLDAKMLATGKTQST